MGDISQSYSGGTPSVGISSFYGGSIPFIRSGEINDEKTELFLTEKGLRNSSAKLVKYGDILYALYGATSGEVNRSKINGAINQAILAIIPNLDYCAEFIAQWLRKNKLNIISTYLQGGQGNLSAEIVKNLQIILPNSKEEQTAIGNFFKQLDDTIALHRRNCIKFQNLKVAYLESIFSAKYIQNKDKNKNAWEQRKLGEIAEIRRGASPRPIQDVRWFNKNSEIGWLRISDVTEQNGRIQFIEQRLSKEGQEKTLVLDSPHLILSIAATVGKPVINFVPTGIHDGFIVFINLKADMEFMFQWLEIFRPNWQKLGQSGSQININSELVREQKILLPISIEEQTAIGNFFKQLDDTIALHQRFWVNNNQFGREYAELF